MAQIRQLGTALSGSLTGTDDREQHQGEGSPEGVVTGDIGDLYRDVTPFAAVIYLKTVGNNVATGWEAVATEVPVSVDASDVVFDPAGLSFFTAIEVQGALEEADPVLTDLVATYTVTTGDVAIVGANEVSISDGNAVVSVGTALAVDNDNGDITIGTDNAANVTIGDTTTAVGFYGHATVAQQTGVAVSAAGVHAALVALGLITA